MALEQETQTDPLEAPSQEQKKPYAFGTLGWDQEQLKSPDRHYTWPDFHQTTNFGNA